MNSVSRPLNFGIAFKGNVETDTVNFNLSKGLAKLKDFSKEEYKTLSQEEIKALRKESAKVRKTENLDFWDKCEELHSKTADDIRRTLDKEYGRGKYTVITTGRSLSSIGKVLGYKIGEENVINIPMSGAGKYADDSYIASLRSEGKLDMLRDFLAEHGLEKEKIENSGKTYVIMDYCNTGASLKGVKNLLTQDCVLGDKNITTKNVDDCIENSIRRKQLNQWLWNSDFKEFSFVKNAYGIEVMPDAYVNTQEEDDMYVRMMWFTLLDNEMCAKNFMFVH